MSLFFFCKDMAVRRGQLDAALVIINHDRWEEALRSRSPEGSTPMKLMIRLLPEAALAVLNVRSWK